MPVSYLFIKSPLGFPVAPRLYKMINIIDLLFLSLAFLATFTGVLINNYEKYLPAFIIKGYKYGAFAYQGSDADYLRAIEIPKAYYRHFYLFSSVFSVFTLVYMIYVYIFGASMNRYVPMVIKFFLEEDEPSVSVLASMLVMTLLALQCLRRLYETYCLQVFAKSSKMNLSHYLVGIVHYFACIMVAAGQGPLFCGSPDRESIRWTDTHTKILGLPCLLVFLYAWYEQYKSNVIFANLRKDKKSGQVVTEDHGIPHGGLFEHVSSPHRMCEVIMYSMLVILLPTKTFICIYLWVLGNQFQTAFQAHSWYKMEFKNYPANRVAIVPHLL